MEKERKERNQTHRLTLLALFSTIALTIFMVESALPTLVPIPGMKLGLANIVTLFVIKRMKLGDAAAVLLVRILLATLFAGQAVSLIYSLCGGLLCLLIMGLVNWLLGGQYLVLTSIFGALAHNLGQILAAYFILGMSGIFAYIPFLMVSGILTGFFTGLACFFAEKKIPRF